MVRRNSFLILIAWAAVALTACKQEAASPSLTGSTSNASPTKSQQFEVNGVVKELQTDGKTIVIAHEELTNFMPAMTMPFEVKDPAELRGLKPGDAVHFQMIVADFDAWIAHITKRDPLPIPAKRVTNEIPAGLRILRDVDPLTVGDVLPEYHFTNQLGQAISTKEFTGQAFAFTFFFTRCPYPAYCPFLANNYEGTQKQLLADPQAPTNWHLLSISFDVATDSPEVLKEYAGRYGYDPAHWSFLTGDLTEITAIADQVGAYFGQDGNGGISHNLRTVVIDATGHVQKIWRDNKWTASDLAEELIKAAKVKP